MHAPLFVHGWGKWNKFFYVHISSLSQAKGKAIHLKRSHPKKNLKSHDITASLWLQTTGAIPSGQLKNSSELSWSKGSRVNVAMYGLPFTAVLLFAKHASQIGCYCLQLHNNVCDGVKSQSRLLTVKREWENTGIVANLSKQSRPPSHRKIQGKKNRPHMHINPHHLNN